MIYNPDVRDALGAALRRVMPALSPEDFERRMTKVLESVVITPNGRIVWRDFWLGRELFRVLATEQLWCCYYCNTQMAPGRRNYPTFEHKNPLILGGKDHPDNMCIACNPCNQLHAPTDDYLKEIGKQP